MRGTVPDSCSGKARRIASCCSRTRWRMLVPVFSRSSSSLEVLADRVSIASSLASIGSLVRCRRTWIQ